MTKFFYSRRNQPFTINPGYEDFGAASGWFWFSVAAVTFFILLAGIRPVLILEYTVGPIFRPDWELHVLTIPISQTIPFLMPFSYNLPIPFPGWGRHFWRPKFWAQQFLWEFMFCYDLDPEVWTRFLLPKSFCWSCETCLLVSPLHCRNPNIGWYMPTWFFVGRNKIKAVNKDIKAPVLERLSGLTFDLSWWNHFNGGTLRDPPRSEDASVRQQLAKVQAASTTDPAVQLNKWMGPN